MTMNGPFEPKADDLERALEPTMRGRTPLAYQLDLFYRLAVRMVVEGPEALTIAHGSSERRRQLETVLMVPHAFWVNLDVTSLLIRTTTALAIDRLAPALKPAPVLPEDVDRVFSDLALLLSDSDQYYARLDALQWSQRYEPIGRTFQPQDPLITHSRGIWKFLYDRTGLWLRPDGESQKVGYGGADWKRNATFIRRVESTITRFVEP